MKLNHLTGHKQQFSGSQDGQLKVYKINRLTHTAISACSTIHTVFNSLFVSRQKSAMHPQHYICLIVISLGVCWVDGIFLTTTAANGALTFTVPTLTATTGTAAAVLGGLGALGAGLAVGALLAKSLSRPEEDENEGYYPVSSGYSSHSSPSYSTPQHSSSYKAPSSGYGHKKRRQGRSVEEEIKAAQEELVTINLEPVFKSLEANDVNDCAKLKVCLMGTKDQAGLSPQEVALLVVFGPKQPISVVSAKAPYDLAFRLGQSAKDQTVCQERYSRCQE